MSLNGTISYSTQRGPSTDGYCRLIPGWDTGRDDDPGLLDDGSDSLRVHAGLLPCPADLRHPRLVCPETATIDGPESDPGRDGPDDGVEKPSLTVVLSARLEELVTLLPQFLPLFLQLLSRRLGEGARRLECRDVLPNRECADDAGLIPDRGGGGEDVHGPAIRRRDRERDVNRPLAPKRPGRREVGRHQRRPVRGTDVEDADHGGQRAARERSAGEGLGRVVRRGDSAVCAVEKRGLPDGAERDARRGRHEEARPKIGINNLPLKGDNNCYTGRGPACPWRRG